MRRLRERRGERELSEAGEARACATRRTRRRSALIKFLICPRARLSTLDAVVTDVTWPFASVLPPFCTTPEDTFFASTALCSSSSFCSCFPTSLTVIAVGFTGSVQVAVCPLSLRGLLLPLHSNCSFGRDPLVVCHKGTLAAWPRRFMRYFRGVQMKRQNRKSVRCLHLLLLHLPD